MTNVLRSFHLRVDQSRLAALAARADAELATFTPRPIVRTRTRPVAGIAPRGQGGRPGKPVRDETGQTYGSATEAAHAHSVKPSDLSMAARSAGRYRCAGLLWWYVEDKL
jgi:hypothetical protein